MVFRWRPAALRAVTAPAPWLALDTAGNPVVSYSDRTNGNLQVRRGGTPTCSAGNHIAIPSAANPVGDAGIATSLALDAQGRPVVSYSDATNGVLKVARCGAPGC